MKVESIFKICGLMIEGSFLTVKSFPSYTGLSKNLGDVLIEILKTVPLKVFHFFRRRG